MKLSCNSRYLGFPFFVRSSIIILIFASTIAILYFEIRYANQFYPGIYLDGESVSGKNYSEVISRYKNGANTLYKNGVTLIFEGKNGELKVNVPAAASGMSPDRVVEYFSLGNWERTIENAYNYGRNGQIWKRAEEQITALTQDKIFDFPAVYQNAAIRSIYSRELKNHFKEPAPAKFSYGGRKINVSEEIPGEGIDYEKVEKTISEKLSSFDSSPAYFKAEKIIPSTTKDKLKPFSPVAREIARGINLKFKYKDYSWEINGRKLITWLKIDDLGRLILDPDKTRDFLYKNILPVLDNPPRSSRFEMRSGVLTETVPGKSGNMVDVEKTVAKVEETLFGRKRSISLSDHILASLGNLFPDDVSIENGSIVIPIVISEMPPRVTKNTISEFEIKELVGSSTTSFKGSSADRIHNIEIGVSKLTGVLIAPDEEFSAVMSIGTTTEEEGFVKEFVIKEDKSVKELGGGLCQIATTLFRLALNAGLPITERINHRYVVGYYGPGLDATIYDPHPDLRFVNDTGKYLLLQGTVSGNELTFEFFGQKDGREIDISKPILTNEKPAPETKYLMSTDVPYATMECSETPRKGVTADVTYTVKYKNSKINEQKFNSVYQPWQKICLIGLGSTTPAK